MNTTMPKFDLTPFHRATVGFDRVFDILDRQFANSVSTTYPPYNIIKEGEDSYKIEIAVAGFREDEIDITVKDYVLTVTGEQKREDNAEGPTYLHKGISARSFTRTFTLGDHVEVKGATVQNGLLVVSLEREVPEEAKPKRIAITFQK
jgi:molecular chaperone IbpA